MPPRKHKPTGYEPIDYDKLLGAIKQVKINKISERAACVAAGMRRSTFQRHLKRVDSVYEDFATDEQLLDFLKERPRHGGKTIFTNIQEKQLGQYIIKCAKINYGLTIDDVCKLAYQFAKKVVADYPANWDDARIATRDWYYAFKRRHGRLSLLKPTPTSANRAKAFNKLNVDNFFNLLKSALDKYPYLPNRIWNADETGFPTVPTKPVKIVAAKGFRASSYASAERGTNVTMTIAVSAAGDTIPPFYLYPRKKMQSTYLYNATSNVVGFANGSGWMTSNDFIEFMKHFVKFAHASKEPNSAVNG
ncbi:PREDICTED: uncharacterized protein LOC108768337 [Trachymyrmex cornetzi]|uniref:uncharacterized protein LOC108768337 n=1 Tax=Trachymyrmex cornetzi TaxID=471704 RepID=UPI00084F210B|nr:PREDICTED: uncharacterized protein LOC108768337 [Trachymyrmex cornetzi]